MKSFWRKSGRRSSGQSQILAAMAISLSMVSGVLYVSSLTSDTTTASLKAVRRAELRAALDGAIRFASDVYRNQAGCDPVVLHQRLSRLNLDGSFKAMKPFDASDPTTAPTTRQMDFTVNGNTYRVSFGVVMREEWTTVQDPSIEALTYPEILKPGISQDAIIEVWTRTPRGFEPQRSMLRAVLVNTCSYPCLYTDDGYNNCLLHDYDPGAAYHTYTNAVAPNCPAGGVYGALNGETAIQMRNPATLANYLRSGNPGIASMASLVGANSCMDFNQDGLTDERDLGLMQKFMRGYISHIPAMCLPPCTPGGLTNW